MASSPPAAQSPCIGICKLDPAKVCIGCGRHVDEVIAWPYSTDDERHVILAAARRRLAARRGQSGTGDFPAD